MHPVAREADPQNATLVRELGDAAVDHVLDVDAAVVAGVDVLGVVDQQVNHLGPELEGALGVLALEARVVEDLHVLLDGLGVLAHVLEQLDEVLGVLGVDLHVAAPYAHGGLARGRGRKGAVQGPDAVVLGQGQGAQGAVEGAAGGGDEGLLHQEVQVHLPDARHLVQQDQGALEQRIDLEEVRRELGRVLLGHMAGAQLEVQLPQLVRARQRRDGALQHEGLLEDAAIAAAALEVVVVQPRLDAAGVALDVLLVRDVLVGDEEEIGWAVLVLDHLALHVHVGGAGGRLAGGGGVRHCGRRLPAAQCSGGVRTDGRGLGRQTW